MLVSLSWLKDYVNIKLPLKELALQLTGVGLGVEEIKKEGNDTILNLEITANRPDCLSIIGIAREVAAIENTAIKLPKLPDINPPKKSLPLVIENNFELCPRYSGIIIKDVSVKPSPQWLRDRLIKVGLRPINNLIDITNYVMTETGNPLHVFDYDKIAGHSLISALSKGGEKFTSVDGLTYTLPKDAIVIKDEKQIIDLCGIKGGENSGVSDTTKNIFIHVPIYKPVLIRKTSQKLSLHSEASAIFERQADAGATVDVLKRAVGLFLELAGGKISSKIIDLKKQDFKPWTIPVNLEKMNKILGINLSEKEIISLLERLGLSCHSEQSEESHRRDTMHRVSTMQSPSPKRRGQGEVKQPLSVTIPTYRNDLRIEEDIIEEVARIYGYNNFPRTMPAGTIPTDKIAYHHDYTLENDLKDFLKSAGFSEIYTYSLISRKMVENINLDPEKILKVVNPVSTDFACLRPSLTANILQSYAQNQSHENNICLFELGKIYQGETVKTATEEYELSFLSDNKDAFWTLKGLLEELAGRMGINISFAEIGKDPILSIQKSAGILAGNEEIGKVGELNSKTVQSFGLKSSIAIGTLNITKLKSLPKKKIVFQSLPKYPAIREDLTVEIPKDFRYSRVIKIIKNISSLISNIEPVSRYQNSTTLRLSFQSLEKTLQNEEIKRLRDKILQELEKVNVRLKK